jgi:protein subunit release factor B
MKKKQKLFSITKDDFEFHYFRAGGNGGQKQNKTSSGCRVIHKETGISAESREARDQLENKRRAWKKLVASPEFQAYLKLRIDDCNGLIKYEKLVDGEWVPWT